MLAEINLFNATALSLLCELLVALGVIVLLSMALGRLGDALAPWISSPITEAKDVAKDDAKVDANAR